MNLIRQFKFFYPEIVWIGIRTRLFSAGPGSNLQSVKVIRQDINPPSFGIDTRIYFPVEAADSKFKFSGQAAHAIDRGRSIE